MISWYAHNFPFSSRFDLYMPISYFHLNLAPNQKQNFYQSFWLELKKYTETEIYNGENWIKSENYEWLLYEILICSSNQ